MQYISYYNSLLGKICLSADDIGLNGLWFEGQRFSEKYLEEEYIEKELPLFEKTKQWLSQYFSGEIPDFMPNLNIKGSPFQMQVWKILLKIPYGKTTTYGEIAKQISRNNLIKKMSAQAVGGAVGKNRIAIIIPCHRVLGAKDSLVGYAGGIEWKVELLKIEGYLKEIK